MMESIETQKVSNSSDDIYSLVNKIDCKPNTSSNNNSNDKYCNKNNLNEVDDNDKNYKHNTEYDKNKKYHIVDMRSDTISTPTEEMRKSMALAVVGDDVYGEDPTVKELEIKSAKLLGKEDSLFVPSGTMANLLAIMVHCNRRGTEVIAGDLSHAFLYEQASAAQIGGVQMTTIRNLPDGTFNLEELKRKIRLNDIHEPITKLVIVENTHNMCGGKILPLKWLEELSEICRRYNLILHMDGARVFNAAVELNVPVSNIVKYCNSVCFCLSKGLSCPIGSILAGTNEFIKEARRLRKALGGGMRQAGVIAAPGLVALEKHVPRLKEDHIKIKKIAEAIHSLKSSNFLVDINRVQTNILLINVINDKINSSDLANRLAQISQKEIEDGVTDSNGKGIILKVSSRDWNYARIVCYHQICDIDVELAIKKLNYVIKEFDSKLENEDNN